MTPEAQRIAIAEACGWTDIIHHRLHAGNEGLLGTHIAKDGVPARDWVPDYLNDLNAMHEVEKVLTHKQNMTWISFLDELCDFDGLATRRATAAQRAEAFLRTLNLYTDA